MKGFRAQDEAEVSLQLTQGDKRAFETVHLLAESLLHLETAVIC